MTGSSYSVPLRIRRAVSLISEAGIWCWVQAQVGVSKRPMPIANIHE
jgi:hypothetical protein